MHSAYSQHTVNRGIHSLWTADEDEVWLAGYGGPDRAGGVPAGRCNGAGGTRRWSQVGGASCGAPS